MQKLLLVLIVTFSIIACDTEIPNPKKLGYQGIPIFEKVINEKGDTVTVEKPFVVPDFRFRNQDSVYITNEDFKNKVYIVDFFFTKCPSICPEMTNQHYQLCD